MREKSSQIKAVNMIMESDELKKIVSNINNESYEKAIIELMAVTVIFLSVVDKSERERFINENLPNSKNLFKEFYD